MQTYTATIVTHRAGSNKPEITTSGRLMEGDVNALRFAHQLSKADLPAGSTSTMTVTEEDAKVSTKRGPWHSDFLPQS